MRSNLAALGIGLVFGIGLTVSQMINPAKVLNFLDLFGTWDASLLLVMASALGTTAVGYRLVLRKPRPILSDAFHLPSRRDIDARLIAGALMFGVGWGIAGLCPGPALTALSVGGLPVALFVASMVVGMFIAARLKI